MAPRSDDVEVPLVREALRRHRWRRARLAVLAFLVGAVLTWVSRNAIEGAIDASWPSSFLLASGPTLQREDIERARRPKVPPERVSLDEAAATETSPGDRPDLLSDEEFFSESPDEVALNEAPPRPELKPLSRLAADRESISDSSGGVPVCQETSRPANGALLAGQSHGPHELVIKNGTSEDAIVKLRAPHPKNELMFYVHGRTTSHFDVPDGNFTVLFAQGKHYSSLCNEFIVDLGKWKYPGIHEFAARVDGRYIVYTVIEFTLHEVPQGNIQKRRISESEWQG